MSKDKNIIKGLHLLPALLLCFFSACASINPQLKNLSSEDRLTYFSIEKIASAEELENYLNLKPEERASWLKKFWKDKDPTPTTEKNEFKEEHKRRIDYVLTNFHTIFGTYPWDERGEVYIIYGEPDERSLSVEASNKDYKKQLDGEEIRRGKKDSFLKSKMNLLVNTEEEFFRGKHHNKSRIMLVCYFLTNIRTVPFVIKI